MPATSIYSHYDGIVHWQTCLDTPGERCENIAVMASHLGLGHHPASIWAIADRLAQPEGTWKPFKAPLFLRPAFPKPAQPTAADPSPRTPRRLNPADCRPCCLRRSSSNGRRTLGDDETWARQGSNLRPLACKARALPLSYAPGAPRVRGRRAAGQAASAATAAFQPDCSRASPGRVDLGEGDLPSASIRNVPRMAMPAFSLNTP